MGWERGREREDRVRHSVQGVGERGFREREGGMLENIRVGLAWGRQGRRRNAKDQ